MNSNSIHLTFTPQQMDYIAAVLASRPYAEVSQLMDEIKFQIQQQQEVMLPAVKPNGHDTTMETS